MHLREAVSASSQFRISGHEIDRKALPVCAKANAAWFDLLNHKAFVVLDGSLIYALCVSLR